MYPKVKPVDESEIIGPINVEPVDESEIIGPVGIEPTSISDMKKRRYEGHHTICQKIREIYTLTDNEDIKLKCRIAMAMAKRMHERLKRYHEESTKVVEAK